ncbi:MAG: glutathione S-transferase [Halobacteriovorax sp.]|nr:glutathione S-transferase [Halobacteriovorax sp.]|tara:strand:+ start:50740 stop:51135 length:396 start_codon:yes stop_codon:yes gene_type:complete
MTPIITPFYAALYTFFYIYMAKQVVNNRWKYKKGLGVTDGELEQSVRAHGNFSEYVPLALILISFLEIQNWRMEVIHALCLILFAARIGHYIGLGKSNGPSKGRFYGTAGTFLVLALASGCLIFSYVKTFL